MARGNSITQDVWQAMLEEYRHSPADHGRVSKVTGVAKPTCAKYWLRGGKQSFAKIALRDILSQEQDALRALRQRTREQESIDEAKALGRLDAVLTRADLVNQRVDEMNLIGMLKTNVIDLIALHADLLVATDMIRGEIRSALIAPEMRERIKDNPQIGIQIIKAITILVSEGSKAAELVLKLERLVMGEPTEHKHHTFESVDDAAAAIRRAQEAAQRRGLRIVDVETG